jgi:hypothetical protein
MPSEDEKPTFTNDAFISYSRKDREFAAKLETALRNYKPPKGLNLPQRNLVVFRDEEDFATVEYQESVERHLERCARTVIIFSPKTRKCKYLNIEARGFGGCHGIHPWL